MKRILVVFAAAVTAALAGTLYLAAQTVPVPDLGQARYMVLIQPGGLAAGEQAIADVGGRILRHDGVTVLAFLTPEQATELAEHPAVYSVEADRLATIQR